MNYFISDLHFGHINCLRFDNRPFNTITGHDEALIKNWNDVVGSDDDVYILGDISWYDAADTIAIFSRLNGRKHLIRGNHDAKLLRNSNLCKLFVEITDYKELYFEDGVQIVLCHYPMPCFKNHFYGWYHLYGHVHNSFEWDLMEDVKKQMIDEQHRPCNMYNVGVMMPYMNYRPRTLQEIIALEKLYAREQENREETKR
jgi:calcineurin-like phosphoesterase family protein